MFCIISDKNEDFPRTFYLVMCFMNKCHKNLSKLNGQVTHILDFITRRPKA